MTEPMRDLGQRTKRKLVIIGMGIVIVVGAILLYFNDPATSSFFPPCPFHLITGLWCPGCGSGRALYALLHGDILHALDLNPLMVLSLPFLGYAGASRLCLYIRGKGLPRILGGRFWGWFVACVVLIYWVARNIAVYPLTVLAP